MAKLGRPSKYDPALADQARKLCLLGATDQEIADFFEINVATVYRWKHDFPDFCEALKVGKVEADERVKRALYHRAVGYEQEAVKIFMPAGAAKPVYAPYTERIAPDTTAAIFWLKNRDPANWRDRQALEVSGPDGGPVQTIDPTKLSAEALRELMEALHAAPETDAG